MENTSFQIENELFLQQIKIELEKLSFNKLLINEIFIIQRNEAATDMKIQQISTNYTYPPKFTCEMIHSPDSGKVILHPTVTLQPKSQSSNHQLKEHTGFH